LNSSKLVKANPNDSGYMSDRSYGQKSEMEVGMTKSEADQCSSKGDTTNPCSPMNPIQRLISP